jgi:hypothetical protein
MRRPLSPEPDSHRRTTRRLGAGERIGLPIADSGSRIHKSCALRDLNLFAIRNPRSGFDLFSLSESEGDHPASNSTRKNHANSSAHDAHVLAMRLAPPTGITTRGCQFLNEVTRGRADARRDESGTMAWPRGRQASQKAFVVGETKSKERSQHTPSVNLNSIVSRRLYKQLEFFRTDPALAEFGAGWPGRWSPEGVGP